MTKYFSIRFVILCLVALAMTSAINGQATGGTGQITGVVADANGAVVPNAAVTLTSKATNQTQTATSTENGIYRFLNLQPGFYSVKTSSGNFAAQTLEVEVQVGRTTDANFTLGAGDVSAVVEVNAEGIQTTSSSFDSVTSETAIQNLPINGRRFQDFVTLTPTAQVDPQRGQISLSGQRGINGNINVDGVDYNQPFFGGIRGGERANLAFTLPQEAIREFQVVAAGYSAEFGRSTGGIVNAVTKSGTNDFRGSAFYLWRPEQLAMGNNFTEALQEQRLNNVVVNGQTGLDATLAPTQHQFGGSIGGPIIKDKLFFFTSYEQQIFNAPRQIIFNFPTGYVPPTNASQRAVYDFYKGLEEPYELTNDAFALLGKVDWNLNDNNRFNVRYNWSQNEAINAVSRGESSLDPTTNQALSTNGIEKNNNNIVVAQMVTNFTSNLINEGRFQWAREERPRESNSAIPQVQNSFSTLGATAFLPTTQYDTRWQFGDSLTWIKGNHTIKFGGEYSNLFAAQTFGFNQFGQYTMNIGSTAVNTDDILIRLANAPTAVSATQTVLGRFDDTRARYNRQIGNLLADFTVKELSFFAQDQWRINQKFSVNFGVRFEQQYNPSPEANNSQIINVVQNTNFPVRGAGYDPTQIPDSGWQVGPRLGFAWDPWGDGKTVVRGYTGIYYARTPLLVFAGSVNNYRNPPGDVSTQLPYTGFSQATFDAFLATAAGAPYIAITGCNLAAAANTDARNRCTPNSVFRQFAIAGINLNSSALNNLPIPSLTQIAGISGALGLSPNPFVGAQITGHDENFENPQSFQYGLGIEREIGTNWVVGVDFGHVKTIHLQRNRDLNYPAPLSAEGYIAYLTANNPTQVALWSSAGHIFEQIRAAGRTYVPINTPAGFINPATGTAYTFPTGSVTTIVRPTNNPTYNPIAANRLALGAVQVRESSAKSLFDEITFRTRLNRSWGVLNAYYTLSRSLSDDDNERDAGGVAFAEPYNFQGEYNYSRLDRRHQFVANPIFFLPYDFEVSSAIRLRSGIPMNAFASGDLNGDNITNDRPMLSQGVFMERNRFRNRPVYDIDLRVQKTFKFGEVKKLVLTSEFFNLFNLSNIIYPTAGTNTTGGLTGQFCSAALQICGFNGVNSNVNFNQIREQNPASPVFGQILINNVNPGSQVFQMQLGARFMF